MAIGVTRVNGDAAGVNNVDAGRSFANASIINTGIASPIQAYKIGTLGVTANLAAELQVGGAVETMLKLIAANATVLAYQVDSAGSSAQLSVITERSSWTDADLQAQLRAFGGNIGAYGNVFPALATVTSTGGIKLA